MSARSEQVLIACGGGIAVGLLLSEGFSGDGDSPRVIVGWLIVMASILVGAIATLLGDQSHPFGRGLFRGRVSKPGGVALVLSALFALFSLIGLLNRLSYQGCDGAGVGNQTDLTVVPATGVTRTSGLQAFPPG
jgi:hypothetical protein